MGTLISYHHNRSVRHHGDPVTSFWRDVEQFGRLGDRFFPIFCVDDAEVFGTRA